MANVFFSNPVTSDTRTAVLQYIRDATQSQARMFDGDTLNAAPVNTVRYGSANSRFERWDGSTWNELPLGFVKKSGDTFTGTLAFARASGDMMTLQNLSATAPGNPLFWIKKVSATQMDMGGWNGSAVEGQLIMYFSGGVNLASGGLTAAGYLHGASAGGPGEAFRIGNDVSLWDVNIGNMAQLRGLSDSAVGGWVFGTDTDNFIRAGALGSSAPHFNINKDEVIRMDIGPAGGTFANNPFWRGIHFFAPMITVAGASHFPRASIHWASTSLTDPGDGAFRIEAWSGGSIDVRLAFIAQRFGYFEFIQGGGVSANLGTSAGNEIWRSHWSGISSGNHNQIVMRERRSDAGADWNSSATLIQRRIDSTDHGFLSFGKVPGVAGTQQSVGFGAGVTWRAWMLETGAWHWSSNVWHNSTDGTNRFYFGSGGTTYIKSGNDTIILRGPADVDVYAFGTGTDGPSLRMVGSAPTVWWQDTNHRAFAIHVNNDIAYFMRGGVNDPNWTTVTDWTGIARWPMLLNLSNGEFVVAGNFYCYGQQFITNGSSSSFGAVTIQGSRSGWSGISFRDSGGAFANTLMARSSDGYGGIYAKADNAWLLQWDGNGNFTATGNVTAYSDERLKKRFKRSKLSLDDVLSIGSWEYVRRDNGIRQIGVKAQEVQRVLPLVVSESDDGYLSVDYGRAAMASVLVIAQEVKKLKEALRAA